MAFLIWIKPGDNLEFLAKKTGNPDTCMQNNPIENMEELSELVWQGNGPLFYIITNTYYPSEV